MTPEQEQKIREFVSTRQFGGVQLELVAALLDALDQERSENQWLSNLFYEHVGTDAWNVDPNGPERSG